MQSRDTATARWNPRQSEPRLSSSDCWARYVAATERGTIGAPGWDVVPTLRQARLVVVLVAIVCASYAHARVPDPVDDSIEQFLAQDDTQRPYRADRHLTAENGNRKGWLDAITEYSPDTGFRYEITGEGGSGYIRSKVLKALLDAEQEVIARGETARSSLAPSNYTFQANGVDGEGLVNVLLSPRRKERVLVAGMIALNPSDGALVRLEGRLAKNPSFWIKDVDIKRRYERIHGTVVPVSLDTKAQVRFLGEATLRMTYIYSEIDGRPLAARR
jgi:hypothetical protein